MIDPRPDDTDQLLTHIDHLQVRPLVITPVPLLHTAFHLCRIIGRQGQVLQMTVSSHGASRNEVVQGKRVEGPESTPQTLHRLIDGFGQQIDPIGIISSSPRVLDVVPHLELLEPLSAGIVNVLSIGDELRRRRRRVGSRHFERRTG